ncbi:MAG: hypothetical protein KDJ77_17740, partial [Rhodobiaceae bacterium]|nr:hypothetical protein [Rhodobiaceae bacterium]
EEMDATLARKLDSLADTLSQRTFQATEHITDHIQNVSDTLLSRTENINETIGSRSAELATMLHEKGNAVVEALQKQSSAATELLINAGENQSKTMEIRGQEMARQLERYATDFEVRLRASSELLSDTIETRAKTAVNELAETNEGLSTTVAAILDKLGKTNAALRQVIDHAGSNLSQVEGALTRDVESLRQTVDDVTNKTQTTAETVTEQVRALQSISHEVLVEVQTTADRLGQESVRLSDSVGSLRNAGGDIESTLSSRQSALEELTGALISRANDIERMMSGMTEMISQTLETSSERISSANAELERTATLSSRSIAQSIEDAYSTSSERISAVNAELERTASLSSRTITQSVEDAFSTSGERISAINAELERTATIASRSISDNFERMREIAVEESGRTVQTMQSSTQSVVAEVSDALNATTDKFNATLADLRQVTGDIARELETTRNEIHRGLTQLPEEARESASAMRRAVAEQIRALNELSAIVASHGGGSDVARPAVPAQTLVSTSPAPRAPTRDPAYTQPLSREPEPAPRRSREPEPRPVANGGRGDRWSMSDLLARASEDTETAPKTFDNDGGAAAGPRGTLNSLVHDIASAIAEPNPADLWMRYRKGDLGAFSQRIYTAEGRRKFEALRQRYREDSNFRREVDDYVDSFDALLDQVARNDRDFTLSRTYVGSDTGKVYLMLAHVSGRFS